ncbi:MAG: hypothetical protein QM820_57200 [Minicystis sp.]
MDVAPFDTAAAIPAVPGIEAPSIAPRPDLDGIVAALAGKGREFARTPPREKAAILRAVVPRLVAIAPEMAAATSLARGLDPASPAAAEAWIAGPVPAITYARLLAEALTDIASAGRPALTVRDLGKRADGRVVARITPRSFAERAAQRDRETMVLFAAGTEPEDVIAGQAAFYRTVDPEGGVALVTAAATDAAAGLLDALFALFVQGQVVLLALPPEMAAIGPLIERALGPLVERGYLAVLVAEEEIRGQLDAQNGFVSRLDGDPGNVAPVVVVPCYYSREELTFITQNLASQLAHGAGLDATAPRVIVLPTGWSQRDLFLGLLEKAFTAIPPRRAYLPGAAARFASLMEGRADILRIGAGAPDVLPWTILPAIDPASDDPLFSATAAPGPVLGIVSIGSDDPLAMLPAAAAFCNDRLVGSLGAQIVMHPIHEDDPEISAAVERAVLDLRYGAVGINTWPAIFRWTAAVPWGSAPPANGGFRNDPRMLGRVDKAVIEGPLLTRRPAHFQDNREALRIAQRMVSFAASPRVRDSLDARGPVRRPTRWDVHVPTSPRAETSLSSHPRRAPHSRGILASPRLACPLPWARPCRSPIVALSLASASRWAPCK